MASEVLNTSIDLNSFDSGTDMRIEYEEIPSFEEIRTQLLPLVKTDAWVKLTKDRLYGTSQSVFYKPLNNMSRIDCGFTVAIMSDEFHYVLNSYLLEWHISAMTLVQISQANLQELLVQKGNIWQTSQTGIRFMEGLGSLAASIILLPDLIESAGGQRGGSARGTGGMHSYE